MILSSVGSAFASYAASAIADQIPSKYAFTDGTAGTCINDGGGDMYDCGNQINVMTASGTNYNQLAYTQSTTASSAGSDITYLTYKASNVWMAAFSSSSSSLGAYYTSGNHGADGGGSQAYGYLGQWLLYVVWLGVRACSALICLWAGTFLKLIMRCKLILTEGSYGGGYYGWYKKVYNAGDPSINEVIITTDPSWSHNIGDSTDNGLHRLQKGNGGVQELYYLMWAGTSGYDY
ncbi:hypothetical protein CYMTET_33841, partial [Cymbomonas tetramitiformis]